MGIKLTEWRLKLTDNIASALSKADRAFDTTKGKAEKLNSRLSAGSFEKALQSERLQSFSGQIPQLQSGLSVLASRFTLAGAGATALVAAAQKGYETALDWEAGMAKINATTQLDPTRLGELKEKLEIIGLGSAGRFNEMPEAFERIVSRVNDVNKSLDVLSTSTQVAKAGFVDIDLAAESIAQTLSITGGKTSAREIADTFLKAKSVGAGEFKDFAQYMPTLIAAGNNLNVDYRSVAGLYSFMTQKTNPAEAAMLIQNAFTAMGKSDIQKGLAKNGIRLFDKEGNLRDLGTFFRELDDKLKGFTTEGKSNFLESIGLRDVQAKNAFAVLAGDADNLLEIMTKVKDSAGEMKKQLSMTGHQRMTWNEAKDITGAGFLALGDLVAEGMKTPLMGLKLSMIAGSVSRERTQKQKEAKTFFEADKLARMSAKAATLKSDLLTNKEKQLFKYDKLSTLPQKARELYDSVYRQELSSRSNVFGGDYNKWLSDKNAPPKGTMPFKEDDKNKNKKNLRDGIDSINEGGRTVRYINVSFKNLVEKIEVRPQSLKEGTNEIVGDLNEMLVRAVSGAEESMINE